MSHLPHYFNLLSVEPLKWEVTDFIPAPKNIAQLRLNLELHAQPAVIQFEDKSVACAFFEPGCKLLALEQIYPNHKHLHLNKEKTLRKVPVQVELIPVHRIKGCEENIRLLEHMVEEELPLAAFPRSPENSKKFYFISRVSGSENKISVFGSEPKIKKAL
mmetsp:Transcript_35852/g.65613  ORF Transcript_35852/g.65613 Transcript_35852/m.65613 type:complete len:160 (+) Transcript_35852:42-521(+)